MIVSKPGSVRTASIVFTISAALLFGVSAVYHRGTWGPKMSGLLKRFDHSNIYLIIAGTYTPFAVTLLPADQARLLLLVIWGGAVAGVLFRVFWVGAPALALHRRSTSPSAGPRSSTSCRSGARAARSSAR